MELSGHVHATASSPPTKEPLIPIRQEAGWATLAKTKVLLGIKVPIVHLVTSYFNE
jgi:hypothetical protein